MRLLKQLPISLWRGMENLKPEFELNLLSAFEFTVPGERH